MHTNQYHLLTTHNWRINLNGGWFIVFFNYTYFRRNNLQSNVIETCNSVNDEELEICLICSTNLITTATIR